jgi:alpha-tubulin suppressor-like RCC1 family protein
VSIRYGIAMGAILLAPWANIRAQITLVRAGEDRTCALDPTGKAYCWGQLGSLRLGFLIQPSPAPVQTAVRFSYLTVGAAHVCGLTSRSGKLYCWGTNEGGAVGDGTLDDRREPVAVATTMLFSDVAAGGAHTCAVSTDNRAVCWGYNGMGQLGDGTRKSRPSLGAVDSPNRYQFIAAGGQHTCAIDSSGLVYCWGDNRFGQTGSAGTETVLTPRRVATDKVFLAISMGLFHTCGLSVEGEVFCWGGNHRGQLGVGGVLDRVVPEKVTLPAVARWVEAGGAHTCVGTKDRVTLCWGQNVFGQLGIVPSAPISTKPVQLSGPGPVASPCANFGPTTTSLDGCAEMPAFDGLTAGFAHTCGVAAMTLYCWGYNTSRQVGFTDAVIIATPRRIAMP